MHLNSFNIDKVVNLAEDLRDKVYVSTRPNRRGYPEHLGPRGGKFYYETNLPSPGLAGGLDFSKLNHKILLDLARKTNSSEEAKTKLTSILDNLYGDDSYRINWNVVPESKGEFRVFGSILDKNSDDVVGNISRTFYPNSTIHHDRFMLNDNLPPGIATRLNDRCEELYRKMGYKTVELTADISIGKYVWARQGYDWKNSSREDVLTKVKLMFERHGFHEFPDKVNVNGIKCTRIDNLKEKVQNEDTLFYKQRIDTLSSSLRQLQHAREDLLLQQDLRIDDDLERSMIEADLQENKKHIDNVLIHLQELKDKYDSIQEDLPSQYAYRAENGDLYSASFMKKYLANRAFTALRRKNNNFKHSWDLAALEDGNLYKTVRQDDDIDKDAVFPLGKALMLSLPIAWQGYKPLDKNSQAYHIGKRYAASKRINKALTQRRLFGLITKSIHIAKAEDPELSRTYVSTEPPHNNEPIHIGERGAPYYYSEENTNPIEEDEVETSPVDISNLTPERLNYLAKLARDKDDWGFDRFFSIMDGLYGDPSYSIAWDDDLLYSDSYFGITGVLLNKDGNNVGTINRTFYTEGTVYHSLLEFDESLPNGLATKINDRCEEMYRQMGFDKVELSADISIGKYAWARQGYDWEDQDRDNILNSFKEMLTTHFFDSPDEFEYKGNVYTKVNGDSKRFLDTSTRNYRETVRMNRYNIRSTINKIKALRKDLSEKDENDPVRERIAADISNLEQNLRFDLPIYKKRKQQYVDQFRSIKPMHAYDVVTKNGVKDYKSPEKMKHIFQKMLFEKYAKENNNFKHSWDLAQLNNGIEYPATKLGEYDKEIPGTFDLGKAVMLSLPYSWHGTKPLDKNSINYKIGKTYAKSKRLNKSYQRRKALSLLDKSIYIAKGLD